jgi:hypothetical protein
MHASCMCRNENDYKPCVYCIYIICATVSEDTCNLVHVVLSVRLMAFCLLGSAASTTKDVWTRLTVLVSLDNILDISGSSG